MASKIPPQQSPQATSSSFWQLISGVAHDLDLMLQDLFPDSIPSPLREEYGLTNDIILDETFTSYPSLLEQFMRGARDTTCLAPVLEDSSSEYRSSKSVLPETPTSDSYDGRTTPTSSPSPPPPAPPPRTPNMYSSEYSANGLHCMGSTTPVGGQPILVSSSSVSSVQDTSDGDSSHTSSSFAPCDIGLLERLIRTHPIWFLPGIGRAGAVHLLQGKDVGNFIVRQSSKPNTMALSVRLPESKGPYVEHYLIETVGDAQLRLEGSDNNFHAIPMLVAHYCQCCDELPVQLSLSQSLAQATSRQELSSLALLGQDFWLSSLVKSPSSSSPSAAELPNNALDSVPQHSTFKPLPDGGKRSGPSPPNTLALSSQNQPLENVKKEHSPSPVVTPPPVAPKQQSRGAPPPPPPRLFPISGSPPCANNTQPPVNTDTSSPDLSSSPSNNENSTDSSNNHDNGNKLEVSELNNEAEKVSKVIHYKQSNIVDLPPTYYKSSLADKLMDYEDIWGEANGKERKANLMSFQSALKRLDPAYVDAIKMKNFNIMKLRHAEEIALAKFKHTLTQGTQTEVPGQLTALQIMQEKFGNIDAHNENGIDPNSVFNGNSLYSPHMESFSSPFYSKPIDSFPFEDGRRNSVSSYDINCLEQRFFGHRFSDPNLHWPQNASCLKIDTLDEERVASLSSSVDNIIGLGPSPQLRRRQNLGFTTGWVSELHQRITGHNLLKKDTETQVSNTDLHSTMPDVNSMMSPKKPKGQTGTSWAVDPSWEWLAHGDSIEDDVVSSSMESKFPLQLKHDFLGSDVDHSKIIEEIITLKSPDLALSEIKPLTHSNLMRVSEYDNLSSLQDAPNDVLKLPMSDIIDDTATEFSEPWDSLRWDRLLQHVIPETDILGDDDTLPRAATQKSMNSFPRNGTIFPKDSPDVKYDDSESLSTVSGAYSDPLEDGSFTEYPPTTLDRERNKSFEERLEPLLAAQRVSALRNKSASEAEEKFRQYIYRLAEERNNTFAMSIENFIQCTKESPETNPTIVMRNIRQFMSGMRNYLVKHGEGCFEQLVQEERSKLKQDEFLNIDATIEAALHELVIKPLNNFLSKLFVNEYMSNGSLKLLSDNIKFARTKSPEELGVRPEFKPPEGASLEVVRYFLTCLQQSYSPQKKLDNLLAAISAIYNSVQQDKNNKEHTSLAAEDFLPIFIYVLVQCGLIAAEIEADYMWGLLHPSLMYGEGGYYLTTLSSAVHVLKSLQACSPGSPQTTNSFEDFTGTTESDSSKSNLASPKSTSGKTSSPEPRLPCIADLQGFMKIMIPEEHTGSIISKTLPVRPNMTTKDVVKMIAHKFNVTNPQDYCLYKIVKGEENLLGDSEVPQTIKAELLAAGIDCVFAYKRCDAKFVWPVMRNS